MKIVFAGTPEFAAVALGALHRAGHDVCLVLTQPDRPAGRGLHALPSAVKRLAQELNLPVNQPATLKDSAVIDELMAAQADAMVVAAYGLIIPPAALAAPRLGCINIHASLLPRWRGAAPIQRAILAGDRETGVCIMQMDAGLDAGPVLLQEALAIEPQDTAQTLHDRLAALGARLIVRALQAPLPARAQDEALATYAKKIDKREAQIDWRAPASAIERQVRAFNPAPGAATAYRGGVLKIWSAAAVAGAAAEPGTVLAAGGTGVRIACGAGTALEARELQRAGGKRLPATVFLAGCPMKPGERLGNA